MGSPWLCCRLVEDTGWCWAQMQCTRWWNEPRGDHRWNSRRLGAQPLLGWGMYQGAVPFAHNDCRWLGHPLQLWLDSFVFHSGEAHLAKPPLLPLRHVWALGPCSWGRFPCGSGSCGSSQKLLSGWDALLPQLLCVVHCLHGAHTVLFIPALGVEKDYFQSCQRLWIWLNKTSKQTKSWADYKENCNWYQEEQSNDNGREKSTGNPSAGGTLGTLRVLYLADTFLFSLCPV